jgi:zinc protease
MKKLLILLFVSVAFAQEFVGLPIEKSDFVTMKFMFRIGSVNDVKDKEGITYLTANLLTDGASEKYTLKQKAAELYPMGTGFGVSIDKEAVIFTGEVHKDHLDKFYDIFKSSLLNNKFSDEDFKRLKNNQLNYVTSSVINTNDEALSKRVVEQALYKNHPYATLVQGTKSGLEAISLDDVKAHFKNYFTKNNLVIGLAGGFSENFRIQVFNDFGKLPEGKKGLIGLPEPKMPEGLEIDIISKKNTFGSAIYMGFPYELTRSSKDFAAMMVMNSWFGEHRKSYSHLYQKMREDRSLNYGDYSYIEWYPSGDRTQLPYTGTPRRHQYFSIWIRPVQIAKQLVNIRGKMGKSGEFNTFINGEKGGVTPKFGQANFVVRQALYELDKLIKNGLTEEDFSLTRDFVRGYIKQFIRNQNLRLGYLMDSHAYGRKDFIAEMDKELAQLTREDVHNAIKKYLQKDNFYVGIITDTSEAKLLAKSFKKNKSTPIIYKPGVYKGLLKELLEEDKDILKFKINPKKVSVIEAETLFK